VLGKEHPSTLTSMNNLAMVLSDQGKYEEAEAMHRQALGLREKALGKEHPSILTSMNNLATVLRPKAHPTPSQRATIRLKPQSAWPYISSPDSSNPPHFAQP
jgi:hypothetical protein